MFDISFASFNNISIFSFAAIWVSLKSSSQYFVSLALFKAISLNFLNSSRELEDLASTRFAPIEVAERINWSIIIQALLLFGRVSARAIIVRLN